MQSVRFNARPDEVRLWLSGSWAVACSAVTANRPELVAYLLDKEDFQAKVAVQSGGGPGVRTIHLSASLRGNLSLTLSESIGECVTNHYVTDLSLDDKVPAPSKSAPAPEVHAWEEV